MEDLMPNGIYRAFYVFCSKTGHWAYQLIELLSANICSWFGSKDKRGRYSLMIYTLLTLCLLAGALLMSTPFSAVFRTCSSFSN